MQGIVGHTLGECEAVIERGLATFVEVGAALLAIRDKNLYRDTHKTFGDYCRERWGMAKSRAYQLIDAAETFSNLSTIVDKPASEGVTRPLTLLPADEQQEAWEEVLDRTEGRPTAADVQQVVNEKRGLEPLMSSEGVEWYTPPDIIERVATVLGGIDLDPCADAGKGVPARQHYTFADDGLSQAWHGRVYMNPPYGDEIMAWIGKLCAEFSAGNVEKAIALVPARTDTRWWALMGVFPVCFVRGRLRFSGHVNSAPFPSAIIGMGVGSASMSECFGEIGFIYEPV